MRLPPLQPADGAWPYQRIAEALRRAIRDGDLAQDDRLPLPRVLARHYGVTEVTAARALKELQVDGTAAPRPGRRGLFLADPLSASARPDPVGESLTVPAAAAILGLTTSSVGRLVKEGWLAYADPDAPRGDRTVSVASLAAHLGAHSRYPSDILPTEAAAALLNLNPARIRQLVAQGRLVAPPSTSAVLAGRGVTVASVAALLGEQRRQIVDTLAALGFTMAVSNADGPTYGLVAKLLRVVREQVGERQAGSA